MFDDTRTMWWMNINISRGRASGRDSRCRGFTAHLRNPWHVGTCRRSEVKQLKGVQESLESQVGINMYQFSTRLKSVHIQHDLCLPYFHYFANWQKEHCKKLRKWDAQDNFSIDNIYIYIYIYVCMVWDLAGISTCSNHPTAEWPVASSAWSFLRGRFSMRRVACGCAV